MATRLSLNRIRTIAANAHRQYELGGALQVRAWVTDIARRRAPQRGRLHDVLTFLAVDESRLWRPQGMAPYTALDRPVTCPDLRVGVIMDEFSLSAWSPEFTACPLTPENWREELSGLDLILIESAWNANGGAWQYQLTGPNAPSPGLKELISAAQAAEIPVVLWNKEDPPHFEDFLPLARLVDIVFTSDEDMIPRYRAELNHGRIFGLAFAAQPTIHNPVRIPTVRREGDVAFAGMYFAHKYPERRAQMDLLLGAAAAASPYMKRGLAIYSRFLGSDSRYQFPGALADYVVGSLPYQRMLTAYRSFKVFLNVNTVVDSPSMCSRRVFELLACGTPVISTPSAALRSYFSSSDVPLVDDHAEAVATIRALVNSPELRERMVHRAQRVIWHQHTYTHRLIRVLDAVADFYAERGADNSAPGGVTRTTSMTIKRLGELSEQITGPTGPLQPTVSVICSTNRPGQLNHLLTQVAQQEGVELTLHLATHGFEIDPQELTSACATAGLDRARVDVFSISENQTLGDALNAAVRRAGGTVVAKFDDDDLYGPHYLRDQVNALYFSGAAVVGKRCTYVYLKNSGTLVRRHAQFEHQKTSFLAGPTLVARREVFINNPFESLSKGEDTAFLRDIIDAGLTLYSSDRFNFVQVRDTSGHGKKAGHTWTFSDTEFLASGTAEVFGKNTHHAWC